MRKKVAKKKAVAVRKAPVQKKEAAPSFAKELRELKQQVARLQKQVDKLQSGSSSGSYAPPAAVPEASAAEVRAARFSPALIKKLRARLGITQAQLAALLGVTGPAVAQWETGTSEPRGGNKATMVALRKLGRRDVAKLLLARGLRPPKALSGDED
jgi:DNA-binding transcriptional regulator YiaG